MVGKHSFRLPLPQGVALWAPIAALLALGLVTTLVDFSGLSQAESKRANETRQRFLVDPATGRIIIAAPTDEAGETTEHFDVADKEATADAPVSPEAAGAGEPAPAGDTPASATAPAAEKEKNTAAEEQAMPATMPTLREGPLAADLTTPIRNATSLVSAPAPEITEKVDGVALPKRGEKDIKPSTLYAQPFKRTPEQVLLSFVVMDAGVDPQSVGLLVGLPREITVAFSPYARDSATASENLRILGHEMWTMLPTMTSRYPSDDPGPMGLVARMPLEEILRRLHEMFASVPGSVGMVLSPDESFGAQKDALAPVVSDVDKRGLLMLSTNPGRSVEQVAGDSTLIPVVRRADLVLDPEPNESQIRSKLAGLIASATEKGEYLVVLSARPQSLQLLSEWLKKTKLPAPVTLAPLSALYQSQAEEPVAAAEEGDGHGGAKKEKPKPKPPAKKQKVLPQDKYLKPAAAGGGGHGGGEKKEGGGH